MTVRHRVRGMAAGISAALDYFLSFVATKSYFNLETSLSMPGIALLNCVIVTFGLILIYKIMPETENRTLEEIEMHFSDKSKKLNDRKIASVSSEQPAEPESGNNHQEIGEGSGDRFECGDEKVLNGFYNRSFIPDA